MKSNASKILSENLKALMAAGEGTKTQAAVGKRAGIDQRTVGRIINCEVSATLPQLDNLGKAFNLLPWQLLIPNLDPSNPPVLQLTETEKKLYAKIQSLAKDIAQSSK